MEKENKKKFSSYFKPLLFESVLFFLTLGLGISATFKIRKIFEKEQVALQEPSLWKVLVNFGIITLLIVGLSYFKKLQKSRKVVFKGTFIVAVFWGSLFLLSFYLPLIPMLVLIGGLILLWLFKPKVWLHNLLIMLGLAGAGAAIGISFSPISIVVLLLIFSVYDVIAVYKTKHMVKMAKEMVAANSIIGFIIPQKLKGFKENLKNVNPGGKFMIIGGGDIVFPLVFCASLTSVGIKETLIVLVFSYLGLLLSYYTFVSQKISRAIPALPPIALLSILGYLLTFLL